MVVYMSVGDDLCPAKTSKLIAMSLGWELVGAYVTMY